MPADECVHSVKCSGAWKRTKWSNFETLPRRLKTTRVFIRMNSARITCQDGKNTQQNASVPPDQTDQIVTTVSLNFPCQEMIRHDEDKSSGFRSVKSFWTLQVGTVVAILFLKLQGPVYKKDKYVCGRNQKRCIFWQRVCSWLVDAGPIQMTLSVRTKWTCQKQTKNNFERNKLWIPRLDTNEEMKPFFFCCCLQQTSRHKAHLHTQAHIYFLFGKRRDARTARPCLFG